METISVYKKKIPQNNILKWLGKASSIEEVMLWWVVDFCGTTTLSSSTELLVPLQRDALRPLRLLFCFSCRRDHTVIKDKQNPRVWRLQMKSHRDLYEDTSRIVTIHIPGHSTPGRSRSCSLLFSLGMCRRKFCHLVAKHNKLDGLF